MIVVQFFQADGLSSLCNNFKLVEVFLCSYFSEGRVRGIVGRLSASGQPWYHSPVQCFLCWDAEGLSQAVRAGRWGLCSNTLIKDPVILLSLAIKQQHSGGRELAWAVWVTDGIEGERKAKQCFPSQFIGQRQWCEP